MHITGNGLPRLRRFATILGRGGFINDDETRVEWSPDGRRLLMQDTALDTSQDETLYILNADGSDALAPRLGTWARWSFDGRTVYCSCATTLANDDCRWNAIDVTSGLSTPLLIPSGARPSVSPDGLLAYDDGENTPSVYVLDPRKPGSRPRFLTRAASPRSGSPLPVWPSPTPAPVPAPKTSAWPAATARCSNRPEPPPPSI